MAVSDVSQKYDVINRIFGILKYQNIPVLTVWPIVPITFLILNNHQSGRLAAKNSNSAEIAFFTFWPNVTLTNIFHDHLNYEVLLSDSFKPKISRVYWQFYEKIYNEVDTCTWRINCGCTRCLNFKKLNSLN